MHAPMPPAPPVINATFPSNLRNILQPYANEVLIQKPSRVGEDAEYKN